tara:strand:- start:10913 stop:12094 length:1182 start_codon:yes stop_codon:yes gene_type:complete
MNKVLFIITGSIAAKRCLEIFRILKSNDIEISCILTKDAEKYVKIGEIKKYINNNIFSDKSEKKNKMLHINLSRKNDLIVVCPATANSIAKFSYGLGDNLASTTLLASNKKIIFVPAMNSQMWNNKVNKKNVEDLKHNGITFIGPEIGKLKCGEFGIGRISSTKNIVKYILQTLKINKYLNKKKCLVTAGPTIEMIDPIRYISNQSSGKQGYEVASQLASSGAKVILISGPTNLDPPSDVRFIKINNAEEMYNEISKISNVDIGIFTAAVSDFKINKIRVQKFKKSKSVKLNLVQNIDILDKIGNDKVKRPKFLVGFAAETGGKLLARKKLLKKNCDMIIYNKINKTNKVFGEDNNKISIITKKEIKNYKKMSKVNCAKQIIKSIHNSLSKDE